MSVDPAPFRTDTPGLLPFTLGQIVTVTVSSAELAETYLDVLTGSRVSFDALRTPYVQATIVTRVPADQATLDALDPRKKVTVKIYAGYSRPDGIDDLALIATAMLRRRRVNRPADLLTIELGGPEVTVIDAAGPADYYVPAMTSTRKGLLTDVLTTALGVAPVIVEDALPATAYPDAAVRISSPQQWWSWVDDLADQLGGRVYHDTINGWHYALRKTLTGDPDLVLTVGEQGTILDSDTGLTREGWANSVTLAYVWEETQVVTDGAGKTTTIVVTKRVSGSASVTSGPFATATVGVQKYTERREVRTTQELANNAAATMLALKLRAGRSLRLSAIAAWWLRPDDTIRASLPLGPSEDHLCSSVEFDLYAGRMSIVTRLPDTASTITQGV